jgi:hypothetical protein
MMLLDTSSLAQCGSKMVAAEDNLTYIASQDAVQRFPQWSPSTSRVGRMTPERLFRDKWTYSHPEPLSEGSSDR